MFCGCGIGKIPSAADIEHVQGPRPVREIQAGTSMAKFDQPPAHLANHPLYQFVTHLSDNLPREKVFEPAPVALPKEKGHLMTKVD